MTLFLQAEEAVMTLQVQVCILPFLLLSEISLFTAKGLQNGHSLELLS